MRQALPILLLIFFAVAIPVLAMLIPRPLEATTLDRHYRWGFVRRPTRKTRGRRCPHCATADVFPVDIYRLAPGEFHLIPLDEPPDTCIGIGHHRCESCGTLFQEIIPQTPIQFDETSSSTL